MKNAYNAGWLHNLHVVKACKKWADHGLITPEQLHAIRTVHPADFYHPNVFIRMLLFAATVIALAGVTGMLALAVGEAINGENTVAILMLLYGLISLAMLEEVFIKKSRHYKSGVTEAVLYHTIGFIIGGIAIFCRGDATVISFFCLLIFGLAAFRYLDLVSTACAFMAAAYFIFSVLYQAGGLMQQIIPLAMIVVFTPLYFFVKKMRQQADAEPWDDVLLVVESLSLLLVYAAGNYLVVRELSSELMGLVVEPGSDIPFAFLFYALTVIIPVAYLYFGLKRKDVVLIRVSLVAIAFSVFTFKYYYSLGHPEITLTLAGAVLLTITLLLFRYLKTPRNGYTRENLLKEKWANANVSGIIVSQTLGGNQVVTQEPQGGGGSFSGGGSTDSF